MVDEILGYPLWGYEFLGNTVREYGIAVVAFIALYIVLRLFERVVLRRLQKLAKRTKTDIDDAVIRIVRSLKPPFYFFIALYLALLFLTVGAVLQKIVNIVLIAWVITQAVIAVQVLIDYAVGRAEKKEKEGSTKTALQLLGKIAKATLWVIGVLLALSNFGVNVSALLAGLGIGGIAVALAAQNLLGDLFSSFVIYFDKPFIVGDTVAVGDKRGEVEKIGIKTTRLRSLDGQEISISNRELTSSHIENYRRMDERRALLRFGVVYETPQEKVRRIPDMVKKIIDSTKDVRFDRAHFVSFGDSSLDFEAVYYLLKPDYSIYRDRHQEILLKLREQFDKERIGMAYPTRTIYMYKGS